MISQSLSSDGRTIRHGSRSRQGGFNLLELIVTLTVASIVVSVGIPSFRSVIMDSRMASEANRFVTSVNTARSYAVRYQREATVCATADYDAAVPSCEATTDWSDGWFVWVDKDRDGATDADEVVSVHEPLSETSTFSSAAQSRFTYDGRGFGTGAADTLTLCDNRTGEMGRVISINNVGRTNVARAECT